MVLLPAASVSHWGTEFLPGSVTDSPLEGSWVGTELIQAQLLLPAYAGSYVVVHWPAGTRRCQVGHFDQFFSCLCFSIRFTN